MEHNVPLIVVYPISCVLSDSKGRAAWPGRICLRTMSSPPTSDPTQERSGSSAERSLRLLALLAQTGRVMSLAELAAGLDLPKATAHRICTQLLEAGFLARDLDQRSYGIGKALRQMAFDVLNHGVGRGARHAVLDGLVREVGETCNFTTLDGAAVLYLDRVEAHWPLRLTLEVGSHVPLHCTASGKLFLAHLPVARRNALLGALSLEALTRNSITDVRALQAECDSIAARGYSTDREEFMAGLIAVAVPVRDLRGDVRAAIAVHAPTARMSLEDAVSRLPALHAAAVRMSHYL
jgi:IclR family transcriptional regulator, acetate operon repressor